MIVKYCPECHKEVTVDSKDMKAIYQTCDDCKKQCYNMGA